MHIDPVHGWIPVLMPVHQPCMLAVGTLQQNRQVRKRSGFRQFCNFTFLIGVRVFRCAT